MSPVPCSMCRQRKLGKLAAAYWAWFLADGTRSAWKLKYCADCALSNLGTVLKRMRSLDTGSTGYECLSCGIDSREDADPVYCTLYLPGKEPMELVMQMCGACASIFRGPIVENGERLPDRGGLVRGPSPTTTAWDALGLSPA